MSSQKGNSSRTRPAKHQNRSSFKNNLHDTNHRTKMINSIKVSDVCARCKDIIDWKIKYKKYKPLTQPKTCVKCNQKTVKQAYHVMCVKCGQKNGVCTKCCQSKEVIVIPPPAKSQYDLDLELRNILHGLPERRRRTFLRYLEKKQKEKEAAEATATTQEEDRNDLLEKLNSLKVNDSDDEDSFEEEEEEEDIYDDSEKKEDDVHGQSQ